jgi:CDP-glucose 4,6-dehydratase
MPQTPFFQSGFGGAFAGRRVLVTGHTGFKGAWLTLWLSRLDAHIAGYSLSPQTNPALFTAARVQECVKVHFEADIRDRSRLAAAIADFAPDVVFHLAAQSLVRESYRSPADTFDVNLMGTVSLLEAVRLLGRPCVVVIVTSDKCYENREYVWGYREIDRMGGCDPYSASKGAAELIVSSYRRSFFPAERLGEHQVQVASVRAGNVIGGGDWAAERIVPDLVRGLTAGESVPVRNPGAVRPWQHVLEPLSGYLTLAGRMLQQPEARWCDGWNFGPVSEEAVSVRQVVEDFIAAWGRGSWQDCSDPRQPHEARLLRLSVDKAVADLKWYPRWQVRDAVARTARWYRNFVERPESARAACLDDVDAYDNYKQPA